MEKITMNDWEYHCRMLADIAKRNGAALMLYYDPHPNKSVGGICKALIGSGADAMVMLASMIDAACEGCESIMTPEHLSEQITTMIRSVHSNESKDTP